MAIVLDRTLTSAKLSLAADNLTVTSVNANWGSSRVAQGVRSGKWYWEYEMITVDSSKRAMLGVMNAAHSLETYVGQNTNGRAYYSYDGRKYASSNAVYGASYGTGDIVGVALDMDAGTIEFFKNGISQGVAYTNLLPLGEVFPTVSLYTAGSSVKINLGAEKFQIVDANPDVWYGLAEIGYKPYDAESAGYWFDTIHIRNLLFSQQFLDHEETGYILVSGQVYSIYKDVEFSEDVVYKIESAGQEIRSGIETTPFDFSFAIDKESLAIGSNIIRITVENNAGEQFVFEPDIIKEDRDTFTYKRRGLNDSSLPREGAVVFQVDKGYVLDGTGTGRLTLDIPTEGKSNINKITIDGSPEIREIVSKTYDTELVYSETLDPMKHFKKSVSLTDLTVVLKAELRR
jgi:hypothetical protein